MTGRESARYATFAEFWPYYLAEHRRPATRACHYVGTALGVALAVAAALVPDWRLLPAALVAGYGPAWVAHFAIERNRPATFAYPLWSFLADFRMLGLFLLGRLDGEIERAARGDSARRPGRR